MPNTMTSRVCLSPANSGAPNMAEASGASSSALGIANAKASSRLGSQRTCTWEKRSRVMILPHRCGFSLSAARKAFFSSVCISSSEITFLIDCGILSYMMISVLVKPSTMGFRVPQRKASLTFGWVWHSPSHSITKDVKLRCMSKSLVDGSTGPKSAQPVASAISWSSVRKASVSSASLSSSCILSSTCRSDSDGAVITTSTRRDSPMSSALGL
mmetsp:Transcript_14317/g.53969  ORF Transcript_14317/g.53969 Transcript_14317/m.53969 type:complete len:214 (+) Transcript_14317:1764-2405(+)